MTKLRKLASELKQTMTPKGDNNFHWVVPGKLATAESPKTETILDVYKPLGINAIVNLQECRVKLKGIFGADYDMPRYHPKHLAKHRVCSIHIPVEDMKAPSKEQFDQFIEFVDQPGRVGLVHCYAGIGRTGCMAAAYYGHHHKLDGKAAVDGVRKTYPYYIQTDEQEESTIRYIDSRLRRV